VRQVILISIDALRFDAVDGSPTSDTGPPWASTRAGYAHDDALAAESVRFTRCVSGAGYTPLSHATIFTGCYAQRHGWSTSQHHVQPRRAHHQRDLFAGGGTARWC